MKTTKTLCAAVLLTALPTLGFAACSGYGHYNEASMSCAEGTIWDADARACVKLTG